MRRPESPASSSSGRQAVLDGRPPRAAVALDVHAEQPELGQLRDQLEREDGVLVPVARCCGLTSASTNERTVARSAFSSSLSSESMASRSYGSGMLTRYRRTHDGGSAARRPRGRRPEPRAGGPDGRGDARRPGRTRHQGRASGDRRRHPAVGSAVGRIVELVLREREPQQAVDRPRLRRCRRPRGSPARSSTAPTSSSRTTARAPSNGTGWMLRPSRERNPRVVYVSITGFGSGAGAELPGYDFLVQAVGGLMSITGQPGRAEPTKVGRRGRRPARREGRRHGRARRDRAPRAHRPRAARRGEPAVERRRLARQPGVVVPGDRHRAAAPRQPPPVDRALRRVPRAATACSRSPSATTGNGRRSPSVIGAPELAGDARFATNAARVEHRAELIAELEAPPRRPTTSPAGSSGWRAAGIPAGKVNDIGEALALAAELGLEPTVDVGAGPPGAAAASGAVFGIRARSRRPRRPRSMRTVPPCWPGSTRADATLARPPSCRSIPIARRRRAPASSASRGRRRPRAPRRPARRRRPPRSPTPPHPDSLRRRGSRRGSRWRSPRAPRCRRRCPRCARTGWCR